MGVDMAGAFVKVNERMQTSMSRGLRHRRSHRRTHAGTQSGGAGARGGGGDRGPEPALRSRHHCCGLLSPNRRSSLRASCPHEAEAAGHEPISAVFPFAANGRALSMEAGDTGGFRSGGGEEIRPPGGGPAGRWRSRFSELSGEFAMSIEMGARLEDLAGTIHVHPTLSEAVHEAALQGAGARDPYLERRKPPRLAPRNHTLRGKCVRVANIRLR